MKLYYAETMNPRKVCAVAKYLGSPVEFIRVDLSKGEHRAPAFLEQNPNGKVPLLVDGELRLWESTAIMAHLAVKAGSDLWPSDAASQVEVLRWLSWDMVHFSRHGSSLYFEHIIKPWAGLGEPNAAAVEEATGFFKRFAAVLDAHLATRDYLVGNQLSIADFGAGVLLPWAKEAHLPVAGFANIERWHERLMALPGWRDPFPAPVPAAA
ncbi:glutathione S-transferase family protein [Dyella sp. LX-66]|uniref:glutathione S-transferase family protein n=1 Tax=unclassified Dyella TaxID=2634549 RepID=UPI001BE09190|nr:MULTISPECIES: glutathione S-transferase family protein [unclassified Dyella]MBT2117885.1 glutathione S-transferase family protein [Dyella sp. LX-1]MBT2142220.1 glutathione S-transferase family protein [Dyella sp. LX-66]